VFEREGWLNVGVAGHKSANIGAGLLANKIIEASSAKAVYPVPMLSDMPSSVVITVDQAAGFGLWRRGCL
jgi:hypothetical protein